MELRANLSFDNYQAGVVYWFDDNDAAGSDFAKALLGVGYFTEIVDDRVDYAGDAPFPGDSVAVAEAPPKRKRRVANGKSESESDGEGPEGA